MVVFKKFVIWTLTVLGHFTLPILEEGVITSLRKDFFEFIIVKNFYLPYIREARAVQYVLDWLDPFKSIIFGVFSL